MARPGGNTTGFVQYEFGTAGKWLELLKQIIPNIKRVAVIRDVSESSGIGQMAALQAVAPSLEIDLSPIDARDAGEIKRSVAEFASGSNGGLIVTESGKSILHRQLIIDLAQQHRLCAIYPYRYFVMDGGLLPYGPDEAVSFQLAAGYVDRILKGEAPADLPVQTPTKYELVINLKSANALGVTIPAALLARADGVIEEARIAALPMSPTGPTWKWHLIANRSALHEIADVIVGRAEADCELVLRTRSRHEGQ